MTEVLTLIGQFGFPIVACVCCGYMLYKQMVMHKEEALKWQAALDNNTAVMKELLAHFNEHAE